MRSWPWGALLPVVVRARFASMCIASEALSAKESEVLARRCALQVCSLMPVSYTHLTLPTILLV